MHVHNVYSYALQRTIASCQPNCKIRRIYVNLHAWIFLFSASHEINVYLNFFPYKFIYGRVFEVCKAFVHGQTKWKVIRLIASLS